MNKFLAGKLSAGRFSKLTSAPVTEDVQPYNSNNGSVFMMYKYIRLCDMYEKYFELTWNGVTAIRRC